MTTPIVKRLNISGAGRDENGMRVQEDVYRVRHVDRIDQAVAAVAINPGDPYPDGPNFIRAFKITQWTRRDDMDRTFDLTWRYESIQFPGGAADYATDTARSLVLRPVWRTPPFKTPASISFPGGGINNDIGGFPVDVAGDPVDHPKWTMRITIRTSLPLPINEFFFGSLQNTRNSSTWRGYAPGTILFMGLTTSHSLGQARADAVYEFAFDPWFHLEQVPFRRGGGRPPTHSVGEVERARAVNFHQPFPGLSNFGAFGFPPGV